MVASTSTPCRCTTSAEGRWPRSGQLPKRGTFVILPGWSAGLLLETFETYRGTHTLVVPTMLIAMLEHPDRTSRDLSSLKTIMSGAAAVPAALVHRTIDLLGCQFSILFGRDGDARRHQPDPDHRRAGGSGGYRGKAAAPARGEDRRCDDRGDRARRRAG